ncbi:MAG: ATP-dependent 6-phosphofructokinase [Deltaproteobacteria bacterium]|nr:ATP-dependent 6-phosphofructokinase [Deltaproteobacteria bacterium]
MDDILTQVNRLGVCSDPSPLRLSLINDDLIPNYVSENTRVIINDVFENSVPDNIKSFEVAGPRENIYFDPSKTRAAIVTCGGLCPGINNVVKSIVTELSRGYGVRSIIGFRYGYAGIVPDYGHDVIELTDQVVKDWDIKGGSMLGSSRGPQETSKMMDALERMNINILFTIGGDGTLRGALALYKEAQKRNYRISIIGVPKTIDNDIDFITKTFGFETAVAKAEEAIQSALVESEGAPRGVGLVKLMGRHSGYIAAHASLANGNVDAVLIPESPFIMEGENGFLSYIEKKLASQGRAVIVVAEGAGQDLLSEVNSTDASGNKKLSDIGIWLGDQLLAHFNKKATKINLKYIDPSYIIRATKASPTDAIFCRRLGENAVHAAMAGKTGMVVGLWNETFTHVALETAVSSRKVVDTDEALWRSVLQMTTQPPTFV